MNTGIGRVTRLVILSATGVLSFAVYLFAQTNDASRPKPKQESPEPVGVVCKESTSDSTQQLEVLSDTMGVDFGPYLSDVRKNVRHNWYSLVPESATWEKGTVTIGFRIVKDGSVAGMKLAKSSGNDKLDRAAWGGITGSDPFQPLPVEFKGSYLALCFNFFYNPGFGISPPGPMKIPAGTTQQFSTGITEVTWAIAGDQCATSDCGNISAKGLYIAPTALQEPRSVTIRATKTFAPFESTSTQVTIVPPSPSK